MKKFIVGLVLALMPFGSVSAAIYAKYDGVDGSSATTTTPTRSVTGSTGTETTGGTEDINIGVGELQEGRTDALLEIKGIEGEAAAQSSGGVNVAAGDVTGDGSEVPGVEPDEIDVADDGEPLTPDFSILLGGGSDEDISEASREQVADILQQGMAEADRPVEEVAFYYGKITTKVKQMVKLFGFIPTPAVATVEIDAEQNVKVKFPWWTFLASGKNENSLGQQIFTAIANVLKTKHDTIKNSIGNVR